MAENRQICDECIYLATVALDEEGKYQKGQVVCHGCKSWQSLRLYSVHGGSITFEGWTVADPPEVLTDETGMTIYTLGTSTDRVTSDPKILRAIQCITCSRMLPKWYLEHNSYLKRYFKNVQLPPTKLKGS